MNNATSDYKTLFVVWHEGIAFRDSEQLASAYWRALKEYQKKGIKHVVIWVDNCAAQVSTISNSYKLYAINPFNYIL